MVSSQLPVDGPLEKEATLHCKGLTTAALGFLPVTNSETNKLEWQMLKRLGRCASQADLCRVCAGPGLQSFLSVHHRGMALQIKVHLLGRLILLVDLLFQLVAPHFPTQPLSAGFGIFGIRRRVEHLAGAATQSQGKVFCGKRFWCLVL